MLSSSFLPRNPADGRGSCKLIQSNSSQDAVFNLLHGLRSQISHVELALHSRNRPNLGPASGQGSEEDDRISWNLQQFVRVAENFHSSASTVVREGPRSTIWGGSILGDPLTPNQVPNIERWIPPPTIDEEGSPGPSAPGTTAVGHTYHSDSEDDDLDRTLVKRLGELALESEQKGDYAKAEGFYRKILDRAGNNSSSPHDMASTRISMVYACLRQGKWAEAEAIITPVAFGKQVADIAAYIALHILALAHMKNLQLDDAEKCCKRALWGKRKVLGKTDPACWETLDLLASICEAKNDPLEAEAHRSFIPLSNYQFTYVDPLDYVRLGRHTGIALPDVISTPAETNVSEARLPPHSGINTSQSVSQP